MTKNQVILRALYPHGLAVLCFFVASLLFCHPVLKGKQPEQKDLLTWRALSKQSYEYKREKGRFPLWNTSAFSGMPNYLTVVEAPTIASRIINLFRNPVPGPVYLFVLACVCFYVLGLTMGLQPLAAAFGALSFAFATYHPIIIQTGHVTKMLSLAVMPLWLAGILLAYQKKYGLGWALSSLGAYLHISANHIQISYYFLLVVAIISTSYLFLWFKEKEWKHMALSLGIVFITAITALAVNAVTYLTTKEYAAYSIRGGKTIQIQNKSVEAVKTKGLDPAYAFQYSFRKTEPLVLFLPGLFGGSSWEPIKEQSAVFQKLMARQVPPEQALQIGSTIPKYWGGLENTDGPPYAGVLVFLLALLGFLLINHPLKNAFLVIVLAGILVSWGKYFPAFNQFLLDYLPYYNKFRAPSMAIVMVQWILPLMAAITLQQLFLEKKKSHLRTEQVKHIFSVLGGTIAVLFLFYLLFDYSAPIDQLIMTTKWDNSAVTLIASSIISGLREDRRSLFLEQLVRTIPFIIVFAALYWLYQKKILSGIIVSLTILLISTTDLLLMGWNHLIPATYVDPEEIATEVNSKTTVDEEILKDTTAHYRVFYAGSDRFNAADSKTSAHHKSIGGYHAAKLRLYQDVLDLYLRDTLHKGVLSMLNARYIIHPDSAQKLELNNNALGNCWLVKKIKVVKNNVEELTAIGAVTLKETAVLQQRFLNMIQQPQWDSISTIRLTRFDNDRLDYEAVCMGQQFAVFSETYYPVGWNVYVNGKKASYTKVNYVLRGLALPAGKHQIVFAFEPDSYKQGVHIAQGAAWLLLFFIVGGFGYTWLKKDNLK